MTKFSQYCLDRRLQGLSGLQDPTSQFAATILIDGAIRCSDKRHCDNAEECQRRHHHLRDALAAPRT